MVAMPRMRSMNRVCSRDSAWNCRLVAAAAPMPNTACITGTAMPQQSSTIAAKGCAKAAAASTSRGAATARLALDR